MNINMYPVANKQRLPTELKYKFLPSAFGVQNFPLLLWLFLCFRLSLHFHCVMSSSLFFSPHFLSAHPSLVFSSHCQHVVVPLIASFLPPLLLHPDFSACFSPLVSACVIFFYSSLLPQPFCLPCSFPHLSSVQVQSSFFNPAIISFFLSLSSHPLFFHLPFPPVSPSSSFSFSIHLSIHHFHSVITLQFSPSRSRQLFPFILFSHFLPNPPVCPSFPSTLSSQHGIYRRSLLSPHRLFLPNSHLSFPIPPLPAHPHHHLLIFINFLHPDFFHCAPPLPFPPHLSIIVSRFDIFPILIS